MFAFERQLGRLWQRSSGAASLPSTPDRRRQGEASGFPRARRCGSTCCRGSQNSCPALFNEFIALLKETSVAGYIAARDLTKVSDSIRGIAFNSAPLFIAAAIYLLLVVGMTAIQKKWNGGWRKVIEVKNLQKGLRREYGAQGRDGDH